MKNPIKTDTNASNIFTLPFLPFVQKFDNLIDMFQLLNQYQECKIQHDP